MNSYSLEWGSNVKKVNLKCKLTATYGRNSHRERGGPGRVTGAKRSMWQRRAGRPLLISWANARPRWPFISHAANPSSASLFFVLWTMSSNHLIHLRSLLKNLQTVSLNVFWRRALQIIDELTWHCFQGKLQNKLSYRALNMGQVLLKGHRGP